MILIPLIPGLFEIICTFLCWDVSEDIAEG